MQTLQIDPGATILTAQLQRGVLTLWAMVDPKAAPIPRHFVTIRTGHPIDELDGVLNYVGTVQEEALVWHVFEVEAGVFQ